MENDLRSSFSILHSSFFILHLLLLFPACHAETAPSIRDDLGRQVVIERPAKKIVSLAPNVTETLVAIGAGDRIVGTDDFSNYPASVRTLPKLGGMSPSAERIAALDPDLVIASTSANQPSLPPVLASVGVPLFVTRVERLGEVAPFIRRLGEVVGATAAAEEQALIFERDIAGQRRNRTRPPRVLFVVWADPLFVGGRSTFVDDLLVLAGAGNYVEATTSGWPQYSYEKLVADPPDIVIVAAGDEVLAAMRAKLDPLTRKAIDYRRVDEDIFSRPGPRLVQAARELNTIFDQWETKH